MELILMAGKPQTIYDTPEQIRKCLNCPMPDCTNCLKFGGTPKPKRRKIIDSEAAMRLWEKGLNDREIAAQLECSWSGVQG